MSLIDSIKSVLKSVWKWIKKIYAKILNFLKNIVNWFRQPERLEKIQDNKNLIAVSIKENLDNGNYNVINCLFDESDGSLVDFEEDTIVIEVENLDSETLSKFGAKDMIVIK